ncbi:hypothetical protein B5S31_g1072 [[Candida] boidinii]|uniref:Unnamed protein product n=1 Tax=Candida boidinii TaxID=5477 RepID=A0ACB5TVX3_CANBO|nr:hypothetical protein B5S31_g1072 [[Candida] boidinii]OWB76601.1 hypothetical protein B5S32_g754 [[Candida] boidinii]GME94914.1 unnamed protein product [[Candida] boidinii]
MEFHAIIFCGKGNALSPISAAKETGLTKALLPVANKPLIEYVLEWCDKAPFKNVSIVSDLKSLTPITKVVDQYKSRRDPELIRTSIMECIPAEGYTTGDMFKSLAGKIKSDFVILPCDFVTDVPPQVLIEVFRSQSDVNLGLSIHYKNNFENVDKKVLKNNYTVYATQEDGDNCLLDLYTKQSIALSKALKIRTQLMWRYPRTSISTKLMDSFIFFGKEKCIQIINDPHENISTNKSISKVKRNFSRRSWKHSEPKDKIGMFILPQQATFARCNNLSVYMEVNRSFLKEKAKNAGNILVVSKEKGAATIGADSIVGDETILGERTSVKRCVVGNKCKIGKKCRLTGCIIMDGVEIEDEVTLENCIIGLKAQIGSKCKLINCNVEGQYAIGNGVSIKGETLMNIALGLEDDNASMYSDLYSDYSNEGADDDSGIDEYDDENFEEFESEDDLFERT